jgi:glycosyltransferase involved in cell wall biosynthesis
MTVKNENKIVPSVSIIVPVFNGMSTLPDLLDSTERQDYAGEYEVILVDDGSTEGSGEYAEQRGYNVIRQKNQGPGIARNVGANNARGELLVFTDSDCNLDPDFITELTKPLLEPEIVGSQGVFYSNQKNIVARFIQAEILERYDRELKAETVDWIGTYAACYRKDVFLANGGFSDIYSSEDAEFSIRLSKQGYKMLFAPKARCQHVNYENFFKFLRFKYKRAYWTIWLYKKYPERMVSDKMTPSARKNMMVVLSLAAAFLVLGLFNSWALYLALLFAVIFILYTIPFSVRVWREDKLISVLSPLFLTARTICYIFGFAKGIIDYSLGKQTVKRSAAK